MGQRISKRKIKKYILWCETELKRLERKGRKMQKENERTYQNINDLKEHYLNEEHIRGEIEAAKYILNNC